MVQNEERRDYRESECIRRERGGREAKDEVDVKKRNETGMRRALDRGSWAGPKKAAYTNSPILLPSQANNLFYFYSRHLFYILHIKHGMLRSTRSLVSDD